MVKTLNPDQRSALIKAAAQARSRAYAPYSNYQVGAALMTPSGQIYLGANVENAAYPSCMCAERVAAYQAVIEGERDFIAVAVATSNGGMPCGTCRQVLAEFGLDTLILIVDGDEKLVQEVRLSELLPGAFGPENLG